MNDSAFQFATPSAWWLIVLAPLVWLVLWRAQRLRRLALNNWLTTSQREQTASYRGTSRTWLKATSLITGLVCLVAALARPQWGSYMEEVTAEGADIFVLLDVSRSMLAEDVLPSRLRRAKSDIMDLLDQLPSDRVGLIAFAGAASVQVPLTLDHSFFKMVLAEISPISAPRGGTMIGDAIRKAIEQFDQSSGRDRAIVLITDGGDQDSMPIEAAKLAAERKIRIIAVGLGDPTEGARIPERNAQGEHYLQHAGQEVWSKMEGEVLRELADVTDGVYIPAQTRNYDLGQVYAANLEQLQRGELFVEQQRKYHERFQVPAAIGLLLLLVERAIARGPATRTREDD